jgi:transcription initiation factor IIE alpha subunit
MSIQIVPVKYVGIFCECTENPEHAWTYTIDEVVESGFVCSECGSKTVVKAFKITTGQMEADAKMILKGIHDLQKSASALDRARERIG